MLGVLTLTVRFDQYLHPINCEFCEYNDEDGSITTSTFNYKKIVWVKTDLYQCKGWTVAYLNIN